jgi:tetratricopeptide (TPR) repeat protein
MNTIPKAFISHSSKDKYIATQIASELGPIRCEVDQYSFDFILNAAAIRQALARSSLFVLLLSENSINSSFVQEEIRTALESRASGTIKQVVIFAIDQTSYKSLPAWLQEINVAQHLQKAKQIARRIDSYLTDQSLEEGKVEDFYLGREEQEKEIRKCLAQPKGRVPTALHIVGNVGVGRKTFLRKSLGSIAPRSYAYVLPITLDEYDGIIELHRKLYECTEVANPLVAGEHFIEFVKKTDGEKAAKVASQIIEIADEGGLLMLIDEGGAYQDNGDYKEHLPAVLNLISNAGRPVVFFIQTRMMRELYKASYPKSAHIRIPSLSDSSVYELMCLLLNELEVEYTKEQAEQACAFADGHPFNVHFIAAYIAGEGIDVALSDPREILEVKYQKGHDFIRLISFSDLEGDIIALLHEYRFCDLEFVISVLDRPVLDITEAIRRLEDFCCIERRDRILLIAPPLRDAIRRDRRFHRKPFWHEEIARRIVDNLAAYSGEDNVPLSLIDSAIPEIIRSGREIPFVTNLLLPSHFLRVGRNYYDRGMWARAVDFCRRALELETQLSIDAKIEANRLLGLALTRIDTEDPAIGTVVANLRNYGTATANRVAYFIEGFRARRRGDYDIAEERFTAASNLDRDNFHICRELSSVLCRMERFSEAEPYARVAHRRSPDNPYILDVLIELLEGKAAQGIPINAAELKDLYVSLEEVCDAGGFHFFALREARRLYHVERDRGRALSQIDQVISRSTDKLEGIYRRAGMYIRANAFGKAREDIAHLRQLGDREARRYADELEANCLIAEGQFIEAKRYVDQNFARSRGLAVTIEKRLARAIAFSPSGLPQWLLDWAKATG